MVDDTKKIAWHAVESSKALEILKGNAETGLSESEVQQRLVTYGPNVLSREQKTSFWRLLLRQFENILVVLLLAAIGISLAVGEMAEALAILAVVVINAFVGVLSESKAEKAVDALRKMTSPSARVLRGDKEKEIPAPDVVPGDILVLREGDVVPADARMVTSDNLQTQEGMLTGESVSVWKQVEPVDGEDIPIGDRVSMVYMGTSVTKGSGLAVVTGTGKDTEMGGISRLMEETADQKTPLEIDLTYLGRVLAVVGLAAAAVIIATGLLKGFEVGDSLLAGVSLAIAAVPEGLPAVVTIAMAFGMARMAKKHALIRRLPSVETLGCTTVICVDKTGTLTKNEMTVKQIRLRGQSLYVHGEGYEPKGKIETLEGTEPQPSEAFSKLLLISHYCNDANLFKEAEKWNVAGDPTEGALLVLVEKIPELLKIRGRRVKDFQFDSIRKMMSTVLQSSGSSELLVLVKGAAEELLNRSDNEIQDDRIVPLTDERRSEILKETEKMAREGLRVLGAAYKQVEAIPETSQEAESGLTFVGLMGLVDPANESIKSNVEACHKAGIQIKMLTGDHRTTAHAIASSLGLVDENDAKVVEGREFETAEGDALDTLVSKASVYSRVAPETKLKIVEALQKRKHVVAMTGDGVNDGPALMKSDIGIAMGQRGTEVARQAADMILQDDEFGSIVAAVKEGRVIYGNISKFVHFLFSCNVSEILIVFLGTLFAPVVPLFPLQILWVNFVTDVFPALALSQEKADEDVMNLPPRPPEEKLVNKWMITTVFWQGLVLSVLCLGVLFWALKQADRPSGYAQTMTFATMAFMQLFHLFNCRNPRRSVVLQNLGSNFWIFGAVLASAAMQMMVVYTPSLQKLFRTVPLGASDWTIILIVAIVPVLVNELVLVFRKQVLGQQPRGM